MTNKIHKYQLIYPSLEDELYPRSQQTPSLPPNQKNVSWQHLTDFHEENLTRNPSQE
jgi:hypothetical protein